MARLAMIKIDHYDVALISDSLQAASGALGWDSLFKPGEKIPVDGEITSGLTAIDEAMLTGESMPVEKQPGDPVYTASINGTGAFQFRATKVGKDTALAQIIKLVEDAQSSKAPIA